MHGKGCLKIGKNEKYDGEWENDMLVKGKGFKKDENGN